MSVTIKSWHGHPVTFPIIQERMDTRRVVFREEVGTFTVEPGERAYENVPANVLDAIRRHHEPSLMRIVGAT